jgi:hypothetical protein
MRRYKHQAVFALSVVCALLALGLLSLKMVQVEVALMDNQIVLERVSADAVGP